MKLEDIVQSIAHTSCEEFEEKYSKMPDGEMTTFTMSMAYHTLEVIKNGLLDAAGGTLVSISSEEVECDLFIQKNNGDHHGECAGNGWYMCTECSRFCGESDD